MADNTPAVSVQQYLRGGAVENRIEDLLGKRAPQFISTLMQIVNNNVALQACDPKTIVSAAITAASMDLPINPNLGFAYIIPYNKNKKTKNEKGMVVWVKEPAIAQFQMGYKGFVQLAQRSGHYKTINTTEVREGEIESIDRLSGEIQFSFEADEKARLQLPIIGYIAYFKLSTGFEKMLYMTVDEVNAHAKKYSQSYKTGYGQWVDNFDAMASKTVLKLLISRFGPMSTQMQEAILADQGAGNEDGVTYVDNDKSIHDNDEVTE